MKYFGRLQKIFCRILAAPEEINYLEKTSSQIYNDPFSKKYKSIICMTKRNLENYAHFSSLYYYSALYYRYYWFTWMLARCTIILLSTIIRNLRVGVQSLISMERYAVLYVLIPRVFNSPGYDKQIGKVTNLLTDSFTLPKSTREILLLLLVMMT